MKSTRPNLIILYAFVLWVCIIFIPCLSYSSDIIGPETKIINNEIIVTTGLVLDEKQLQDLQNGIAKEITFYIDLFRVWNLWPDEFILGKIIVKTLKCDPVKKEYVATSFDGTTRIERRFSNLVSLIKWALNVQDLKLTNIKEIEPDEYFVRITVESRFRRLPPVISHLFFFVPEKEFKVIKDTPRFPVRYAK